MALSVSGTPIFGGVTPTLVWPPTRTTTSIGNILSPQSLILSFRIAALKMVKLRLHCDVMKQVDPSPGKKAKRGICPSLVDELQASNRESSLEI